MKFEILDFRLGQRRGGNAKEPAGGAASGTKGKGKGARLKAAGTKDTGAG
ncbi:MAG: hypothetical protein ACRD59_12390 [Candidatus Acidiferrales bacterium]